jgi:pimeloyl-ACP methyl ester carboxylesterase
MHLPQQHRSRRAFVKSAILGATGMLAAACLRPAGIHRAEGDRSTVGVMEHITSGDGTRIAVWRSGTGPPLLLVHGSTYDHTTAWRFVVPELERRFTVYAMDRRGRGGSGDSRVYELQREAEDVAAVVDAIGEPVNLFGHSYGALCGIEAALLTPNLGRMILYEGVPLSGADYYPPGVIEDLEALLEAGDVEGMLITMMREVIQRPPEEIELLRSQQEDWAARLRNAPTIPREMRGEQGYAFNPERFSDMRTPTVLLVGGDSPPGELTNAEGVSDGLPDAQVVILPGQRHTAMITGPDVLISEVVQFLES